MFLHRTVYRCTERNCAILIMSNFLKRLSIAGVLLALVMLQTQTQAQAQVSTAVDLANQVNALRAQYGLAPYQLNSALMSAAQSHSEWEAATGTISHTGQSGTTPTDRAIAAGYGERANIRVSENIYAGTNATSATALEWWINSPIHFRGLTSPNYTEIGVGVVTTDGLNYYTLVFGDKLSTLSPAPQADPASEASGNDAAAPAPESLPVFEVVPVEVAETADDGSVVHVVESGQNVWDIAVAYDVAPSEIQALNRLDQDASILPGQQLVIVPAEVRIEVNEDGSITHDVEEGQSLWVISREYDVELARLLEINGLTEGSIIRPGDQLLIQPPTDGSWVELEDRPKPAIYHTVVEGQVLYNIAAIHGVAFETLLELNDLTAESIIRPGDQLLIRPADEPLATLEAAPVDSIVLQPESGKPDDVEATSSVVSTEVETTTFEAEAEREPHDLPSGALIAGLAIVAVLGLGLIVYGGFNFRKNDDISG